MVWVVTPALYSQTFSSKSSLLAAAGRFWYKYLRISTSFRSALSFCRIWTIQSPFDGIEAIFLKIKTLLAANFRQKGFVLQGLQNPERANGFLSPHRHNRTIRAPMRREPQEFQPFARHRTPFRRIPRQAEAYRHLYRIGGENFRFRHFAQNLLRQIPGKQRIR